jgi:hypothetical protein
MLQAAPPDPNGRRHEDGDLTGRRLAVTRLRNIRERAREKGPAESPVTVPTSETFLSLFWPKKDELPGSFFASIAHHCRGF